MIENYNIQREASPKNYVLVIIAIVGVLFSTIAFYFSGFDLHNMYYRIVDWASSLASALLVNKICANIRFYSKKKIIYLLPYVFFIPTLIYSFQFLLTIDNEYNAVLDVFYKTTALISAFVQIFVAYILINELNKMVFVPVQEINNGDKSIDLKQAVDRKNISDSFLQLSNEQQLGNGNTILDKVIKSILVRANSSNRVISFTLVIMLVLVVIGGGASFGTVALSEAKKVRELEAERLRMLEIVHTIQSPSPTSLDKRIEKLEEIINLRYGNENSYKSIIENIEKQSYVSWPDIAMRITIAALTLFLVQVFFHIYKYNQQQASHLFTRAEILELYKEANADQNELRLGLLTKVDSIPKFEKSPSTPTDQIINVITKAKDSK